MKHQAALQAILEAKLAEAGAVEWEQRLSAAGVPVGPVLSVPQIAEHPQMRERGQLQTLHVPALDRDVQVVGLGFQLGGRPVPIALPPPALGEHTGEVLRGLGCTDGEIAALRDEGVI